jgi:hypothetical protein
MTIRTVPVPTTFVSPVSPGSTTRAGIWLYAYSPRSEYVPRRVAAAETVSSIIRRNAEYVAQIGVREIEVIKVSHCG